MKRMNKKGFTLIELLAVVVIMLAIAIERNKAKQDNAKIEVIVSTAKLYYESHKNSLGTSGCISISKLDLTENERKKSNGDMFNGGVSYTNGSNFEYKESC